MAQDPNALVWIDLEMTGLDPLRDSIIEIATIITDSDLNTLDYRDRSGVADARLHRAIRSQEALTAVRQFRLPGSSLPEPLHAASGSLPALSQP